MQTPAIGLPWYKPGNFTRLRAICADGNVLEDSYDDWLAAAEKRYERLVTQGKWVIKANINPAEFQMWCDVRGLRMDSHARKQYAEMIAHQCVGSVDFAALTHQ